MIDSFVLARTCLQSANSALSIEDIDTATKALVEHDQMIRKIEVSSKTQAQLRALYSEQQVILQNWRDIHENLRQIISGQRRSAQAARSYLTQSAY